MWSDCILIRFETESQASELTTLILMCQIFDGTLLSLTMMSYNMVPCRFYSWMQSGYSLSFFLSQSTHFSQSLPSAVSPSYPSVIITMHVSTGDRFGDPEAVVQAGPLLCHPSPLWPHLPQADPRGADRPASSEGMFAFWLEGKLQDEEVVSWLAGDYRYWFKIQFT